MIGKNINRYLYTPHSHPPVDFCPLKFFLKNGLIKSYLQQHSLHHGVGVGYTTVLLASSCTHGASQHWIWPKYLKVFYDYEQMHHPPYLPAIIWSNPTGRAICSWFQFPHTHKGMCALKSLIEMDWVIQLTLTHLGVLCAVEAFALGYCHKSLSRHRTSTPVLTVFIKLNWVELFLKQKASFFSPHLFFYPSTVMLWKCMC